MKLCVSSARSYSKISVGACALFVQQARCSIQRTTFELQDEAFNVGGILFCGFQDMLFHPRLTGPSGADRSDPIEC